jgi:hypothetical protein
VDAEEDVKTRKEETERRERRGRWKETNDVAGVTADVALAGSSAVGAVACNAGREWKKG